MSDRTKKRILLTGATGYVGGRLLKELEKNGYAVRCFTRRASTLGSRVSQRTEVFQGDVLDAESLSHAMEGSEVAYYLVHSMGSDSNFEERDQKAALLFSSAARSCGVRRIIYLGGLSSHSDSLSPHLRSRLEVGRILRDSGVPTIEFQASIVIGSGSLSFELIRNLVERLPLMLTPRWVQVAAQPIFIDDVLEYLIRAIDIPLSSSHVYEIGGADVTSYRGIMEEYAHQRGLKRFMISVPVLTPALSSLWLNLITPVYARIGRKLIDSIRHPSIVQHQDAMNDFDIHPIGIHEAISKTLEKEERYWNETRWSDSFSSVGAVRSWGGVRFGNRIVDRRSVTVPVSTQKAFIPIRRIGGTTGWYYGNWLWHIRGLIDSLCGGVGLRRGRRDPEHLRVGDALDFWRVEEYEPDKRLRLFAEMKLPGRAWLEFEVKPLDDGAVIYQTAIFDPLGILGKIYWHGLYPIHVLIFRGMLERITLEGKKSARSPNVERASRTYKA
jgi:uncharacterized protein YbjT (DUF2867 family)